MKGYQLKIAEKNKKPPVWSRAILPAGITFSQLSILLTEIMGYQGDEIFEFEFFQKKVRLFEEQQVKDSTSAFYYDRASAPETFINDLLDSEEWFSFYWGADISCRVTIEKRLDDFSYSYACVQRFRGISANIEDVNDILEKRYAVSYGESDFRNRDDLLNGISSGTNGLTGSLEAVSKPDKYIKSSDRYMREIVEQLNIKQGLLRQIEARKAEIQELKARDTKVQGVKGSRGTLKQSLLAIYTMPELKAYASRLHLNKVSALNKDKLTEKIKNEILSLPVMKRRLSVLTDEQIEAFERAISMGRLYRPQPEQLDILMSVYDLDYIIIYDDDFVEVPGEVMKNYTQINKPEFHQLRKQIVWMQMCLQMHAMIYGIAPIEIVHRMYRKRKGYKVGMGEWLDIFYSIPEEENRCIIKEGKVIQKNIIPQKLYLHIEQSQGDKEFYVPAYSEVADCIKNHYPSQESAYRKLKIFFINTMDLSEGTVLSFLQQIWSELSLGYDLSDIIESLGEEGLCFNNERQFQLFAALIQETNNETRLLSNRGFKPNELSAMRRAKNPGTRIMPTIVPASSMAAKVLREAQLDLDAKRKIYPNDPCPCQSGKKYKKCCGKN
ncbi:MAG: IS1096 element passenger TnpR family protein [Lachnospiraceae bacterium]